MVDNATEEPVAEVNPTDDVSEVDASEPIQPGTKEPAAPPAQEAATPDEWAGQLETIERQDWYQKVPEDIRDAIKRGIEETYKGFQRAHTSKSLSLADERKAFAEERRKQEESIREERRRVSRMLYGEEDPTAAVREEWEAKEKVWLEAAAAEKAKWETEMAEARKVHEGPLTAAEKRAQEAEERLAAREAEWRKAQDDERGRAADAVLERFKKNPNEFSKESNFIPNMAALLDEARSEQFADAVADWLQNEARDIYNDEGSFAKFWALLDTGESASDAIAFIRFKNGTAQKPPSPAEEVMTVEAPPSTEIREVGRKKESYWEMMRRAQQEAAE
jgi:hypothetical protein